MQTQTKSLIHRRLLSGNLRKTLSPSQEKSPSKFLAVREFGRPIRNDGCERATPASLTHFTTGFIAASKSTCFLNSRYAPCSRIQVGTNSCASKRMNHARNRQNTLPIGKPRERRFQVRCVVLSLVRSPSDGVPRAMIVNLGPPVMRVIYISPIHSVWCFDRDRSRKSNEHGFVFRPSL